MTGRALDRVLGQLKGVLKEGGGFKALCPAHRDTDPSLHITEKDGKVLLQCFGAKCTAEAIVKAMGLRMSDLFDEPLKPRDAPIPRKKLGTVAETYDYVDEHGEIRFQVLRYEPKDFRQRRPNESGGWTWGVTGVPLILYRYPGVRAAVNLGGTIYVAEGEKDVHALEAAGVIATCNPMGAGKWREEFTEALQGADEVVIVADRDTSGRKHAAAVYASLTAAGIPTRVVEAAVGKDATDHLAAGYGVLDFAPASLAEEAPEPEPEGEEDDPLARYAHSLVDWSTFWDVDHKQEEWLVEPILPLGRSIAVYSPAKAGKSLLTLDIAAALATGRRIFDRPAGKPLNVLYLDLEMTEGDLYERLEDMGYGKETDLSHLFYYLLPNLPPLDTPDGGAAVRDLARKHNADLVIIDTTSRVISGAENDSDTMRAFYQHTGLPLKADGRTVCRLDHAGKDRDRGQRGTSAKNDDVDLVWELTSMEGTSVRLRATHRRQSWVDEYVFLVRLEGPLRHERAVDAWPHGTEEIARALDRLAVPLDATIRSARSALKEHGVKNRSEVLSAALRYRRAEAESDPTVTGIISNEDSTADGRDRAGSHLGSSWDHAGSHSTAIGDHVPPLRGDRDPTPRSGATPLNGCVDCGVVIPGGRARCDDCAQRLARSFDDELQGRAD